MKKHWMRKVGLWALVPFIVFTMACGPSTTGEDAGSGEESTNNFPQAEVEN